MEWIILSSTWQVSLFRHFMLQFDDKYVQRHLTMHNKLFGPFLYHGEQFYEVLTSVFWLVTLSIHNNFHFVSLIYSNTYFRHLPSHLELFTHLLLTSSTWSSLSILSLCVTCLVAIVLCVCVTDCSWLHWSIRVFASCKQSL